MYLFNENEFVSIGRYSNPSVPMYFFEAKHAFHTFTQNVQYTHTHMVNTYYNNTIIAASERN